MHMFQRFSRAWPFVVMTVLGCGAVLTATVIAPEIRDLVDKDDATKHPKFLSAASAPQPLTPPPPVEAAPPGVPPTSLALESTASSVAIYPAPDGTQTPTIMSGRNPVDQPQTFLVFERIPGWYHVRLPNHPMGSTGWIPENAQVSQKMIDDYIVVRVSQAKLEHWVGGTLQHEFPVAVGKPSTPTPLGQFYVMGVVNNPIPMYEPVDIGLNAFSTVLTNWADHGRTGLHGWGDSSVAGKAVSNGCVRIRRQDAALLETFIEVGTPVDIVA